MALAAETKWYYFVPKLGGDRKGPVFLPFLQDLFNRDEIGDDTLVWAARVPEITEWIQLADLTILHNHLKAHRPRRNEPAITVLSEEFTSLNQTIPSMTTSSTAAPGNGGSGKEADGKQNTSDQDERNLCIELQWKTQIDQLLDLFPDIPKSQILDAMDKMKSGDLNLLTNYFLADAPGQRRILQQTLRMHIKRSESEIQSIEEVQRVQFESSKRLIELNAYKYFLSGLVANDMLNQEELEALQKVRDEYNIRDGNHSTALSELGITEEQFTQMQERAAQHTALLDSKFCSICRRTEPSYIILDCMHVCLCEPCAQSPRFQNADTTCPKCNGPVRSVRKTYRAA